VNAKPVELLLVEDNPNDVELTLHAFAQHDLATQIHVARDGVEALDFLFCEGEYAGRDAVRQPKVILLDLKLPKVDGLEVLRRIRSEPALRALPVVVVTASRKEQDIVEAYNLGANSYIVKPINFDQFIETARQLGLYWLLLNETPGDIG
jgi:two-component system, response regulator